MRAAAAFGGESWALQSVKGPVGQAARARQHPLALFRNSSRTVWKFVQASATSAEGLIRAGPGGGGARLLSTMCSGCRPTGDR